MSQAKYSQITTPPESTELLVQSYAAERPPPSRADTTRLGRPRAKRYFNTFDILAVVTSLACLATSICVVTPHLSLSWRLGFEGQIVVVGFLLSGMNLCLKRVAPTLFLNLEARWGSSFLQNYDSILRNTITLSHTGLIWRLVLLFLILLPLGLSAAYKRFTGGQSTTSLTSTFPGHYGLAPPPMGSFSVMNNSIFLMINASVPFLAASADDSKPLIISDLPLAYGFNTLLLDNSSAALLDIPDPEYVSSIQRNLTGSESWTLSASVNATVVRFDPSFVDEQNNDEFWQEAFLQAAGFGYLSSAETYQANFTDLGLMVGNSCGDIGPYCLLGFYSGYANGIDQFSKDSEDALRFRNCSPLKFNIQRERCAGTWKIAKYDLRLVDGSCTGVSSSQGVFCNSVPFYLDALPIMVQTVGPFSSTGSRNASHWKIPAFVTSVATMYWARMVYINHYLSPDYISNTDLYYLATNETITSTNATLDAKWLLYLVLTVQPLMVVAFFVCAICLYDTPVDKGFGLVAILSGVDRDSIGSLQGAALSGELRKPVNIDIIVLEGGLKDSTVGQIQYSVGHRTRTRGALRTGKKYA